MGSVYKGVIHRDLRPSNVLVALYDDRPVPKVIDFGVAKAAGQTLTDKTLMTGFGAVVGTPEYMSPEQASLNNLDIDTRSDVYSLGVLLYELLTGYTPVDRKSLGKAALLEVLRIVREVETPRPSAKLSTIDTLPGVAANRGTEPAKLSKLMKGELDWVLLKALEKDRARRYDTANGLAHDIQRYLADEVVEARPPSAGYRLRKFVKRHKVQVVTAGLVVTTLLAGVVGTTWGLVEARTQAEIARGQTRRAETNEAEARRQRGRADEEAMIAKSLNGFVLEQVLGEVRAASADLKRIVGEIVDGTTAMSKRAEFVASVRRLRRANDILRALADKISRLPTLQFGREEKAMYDALCVALKDASQPFQQLKPLAEKYPVEMSEAMRAALRNPPTKK